MKPSATLALKRAAVREATSCFRAANPRVFGSALRGTDQDGSDLDLLVNTLPGATLFDLGGLQDSVGWAKAKPCPRGDGRVRVGNKLPTLPDSTAWYSLFRDSPKQAFREKLSTIRLRNQDSQCPTQL